MSDAGYTKKDLTELCFQGFVEQLSYDMPKKSFEGELRALINRHSVENRSDTPDYVLASFMRKCLEAFEDGVRNRELFFNRKPADNVSQGLLKEDIDDGDW